jgi:hypothetical protein
MSLISPSGVMITPTAKLYLYGQKQPRMPSHHDSRKMCRRISCISESNRLLHQVLGSDNIWPFTNKPIKWGCREVPQ